MFFSELPAILVAVYDWNFRILQTIIKSIKRALNKESSYEISLKLDEKCSRGISYSRQNVFFQSLHYTCFSSATCPLQVPAPGQALPRVHMMICCPGATFIAPRQVHRNLITTNLSEFR